MKIGNLIIGGKGKKYKEQIEYLKYEINESYRKYEKIKTEYDDLNKAFTEYAKSMLEENNKLSIKLINTEKSRRKSAGEAGGLIKRNNELIAQNTELALQLTELRKEFEEFKKNKFIVKEMKPQKVPRCTQTMGIKSGAMTSRIITKVKAKVEE